MAEQLEENVFVFPDDLEIPETVDGSLGPFTTESVYSPDELGVICYTADLLICRTILENWMKITNL